MSTSWHPSLSSRLREGAASTDVRPLVRQLIPEAGVRMDDVESNFCLFCRPITSAE